MSCFVKKMRDVEINPWSGLSKKEAFNLEKKCLNTLNKNFICICNKNCNHFPKILSCNDNKYYFILSYCGYSINKYKDLIQNKKIKPIIIDNIEDQINCIIYNLKKCKIKHLDMRMNGQNICINKKGFIYLIDFDFSSINDEYITNKIKIKNDEYGNNNYYDEFKNKLILIISNII